jgi:hypothetical protein
MQKNKNISKFIRLTDTEKGYFAGFLDGGGSIVTQIVEDKTYKFNFYIRISIIFYQKEDRHWFILFVKKKFEPYGFTRKRTNMSEFVVVAKKPVKLILKTLYPFLIIKRPLCKLVLEIIDQLENVKTEADFLEVCKKVDETANHTYSKNRKINYDYVKNYLNSPVETSYTPSFPPHNYP